MLSEMSVKVTGTSPLLMHSTRGMDTSDPLVRDLKALTSKHAKKKTDEDLLEIQRLEFVLGLYHDGKTPILPADMVLAGVRDGAKAQRLGSEVTRSVFMGVEAVPLEYSGPKDVKALWKDRRFVDVRSVKVGQSRVMRTRPVFNEWAASFVLSFDEDHLDRDALQRAVRTAGERVGFGDYRPRYGRFNVEFV